jgi:hypothetical protein
MVLDPRKEKKFLPSWKNLISIASPITRRGNGAYSKGDEAGDTMITG